jgi:hypothetical protein
MAKSSAFGCPGQRSANVLQAKQPQCQALRPFETSRRALGKM